MAPEWRATHRPKVRTEYWRATGAAVTQAFADPAQDEYGGSRAQLAAAAEALIDPKKVPKNLCELSTIMIIPTTCTRLSFFAHAGRRAGR